MSAATNSPLRLTAFLTPQGYHESAWKVGPQPVTADAHETVFQAARTAERGLLDAVFIADSPMLEPFRARYFPQVRHDPIALVSALSVITEHIGLVATASTTYSAPYDLARRLATVDHLSGGRAGWNVVTTRLAGVARNFGTAAHPEHGDRYARAGEFVDLLRRLWDGWDDDAVVADADSGVWADVSRIREAQFHGEYYDVDGALPLPRSPQGHPVLAQAGSSGPGVDLAGRIADLVFTAQPDIAAGRRFRDSVRGAARAYGRAPDSVSVMPGLSFVLGSTDIEAQAKRDELENSVDPEFRWRNLAFNAGIDPELLDPNVPLDERDPALASRTSRTDDLLRRTRETGWTFRRLSAELTSLPGGLDVTATPEQLADLIESWFTQGASDGFTLQPSTLPDSLELFVDHVVPILQARGLHRTEYTGTTLRDHLGITRPESNPSTTTLAPIEVP
ncbi:NtaA/DmoA family FMN-dependent monooxygenase [Rhodococcus globerulus]|uniref:NtaA/DmoA family FMN-dependent monooxygenase n=1 Tax=Rhodococcus globerulus TaxID=33008 RepID=A0ABU4C586_RHOGO|nr:NtaA/DmoA family FMN-dependent monooxygenase [Rhodococcus globerulus]MDV6271675.1 NtaA/DmoA family FMN-dependent monooxygenase [Rhodococcus globerulus]